MDPLVSFRAVLPPLSVVLRPSNPVVECQLIAMREITFLTIRPPNLSLADIQNNLATVVEEYMVIPIILSLFSVCICISCDPLKLLKDFDASDLGSNPKDWLFLFEFKAQR